VSKRPVKPHMGRLMIKASTRLSTFLRSSWSLSWHESREASAVADWERMFLKGSAVRGA
jgi:hypothetical protein